MNEAEIINQIKASKGEGIKAFAKGEILENQRRILQSPLTQKDLKNDFGIELTMPSAYQIFKKDKDAIWFQKPTKYGTSNILISNLR